jgi:iron complex outermembrane recepter protein
VRGNLLRCCLLASIGVVSAMPAMSQELEEVIVSATRRQESAQAVPISITAISADSLEKAEISGVKELQFVTTGLQIANRSAAFVPYIRGIGTLDVAAGQETAVAVYIDGVYLSSVWGTNMSFSGIDRVEVLKGPQGTLFGRNATGGLIHVITKDPSHETKFNGAVSYGNYNTVGGKFYATTGITKERLPGRPRIDRDSRLRRALEMVVEHRRCK